MWLNKVGDLDKITFDKVGRKGLHSSTQIVTRISLLLQYLVGRLLEFITDVQFTSRRIFVTYLESRVTIVQFGRQIDFADAAYDGGVAQYDPRVSTVDLLGPAGRR